MVFIVSVFEYCGFLYRLRFHLFTALCSRSTQCPIPFIYEWMTDTGSSMALLRIRNAPYEWWQIVPSIHHPLAQSRLSNNNNKFQLTHFSFSDENWEREKDNFQKKGKMTPIPWHFSSNVWNFDMAVLPATKKSFSSHGSAYVHHCTKGQKITPSADNQELETTQKKIEIVHTKIVSKERLLLTSTSSSFTFNC